MGQNLSSNQLITQLQFNTLASTQDAGVFQGLLKILNTVSALHTKSESPQLNLFQSADMQALSSEQML